MEREQRISGMKFIRMIQCVNPGIGVNSLDNTKMWQKFSICFHLWYKKAFQSFAKYFLKLLFPASQLVEGNQLDY